MEKNYFTLDENFNKIIENSLSNKEITAITPISTGWTNIVFEAKTKNDGDYFFRFPRDDFWTRTIEKDCEFSKFIKDKTYVIFLFFLIFFFVILFLFFIFNVIQT